MNVFETCLPKRTGTPIYLPEDDDYENTTQHRNCFSCCLWTNKFSRQNREGLIRLPEGGRRTIDDYLDPRSPVSIEVLLAEQEEELDHYLGQATDDEDAFVAKRKYSLVSHNNAAFEEEDAQFLSEHRISAILVDRPKLSNAHVFNTENVIDSTSNNNNQEFLDVVIPAVSTSTSSISSRVFAIKIQPEDEDDFNKKSAPRPITDVLNISSSPKEMRSTSYRNHHISSSSSSSSSATSILSSTSTAEHENNYVLPSHLVVGSSTSLSVFPPANITSSHQSTSRTSDFPATTLTRTPYQPPPPMQLDIPPSTPPRPISPPSAHNTPIIPTPFLGRRPSVVQAAQNLLGDKLDDFTEKLAFIKKNIIMSMDNEDEEELSENNHYYNTANTFNKGRNQKSLESSSSSSRGGGEQSGERTWDNFILPKFKKQPSTSTSFLEQNKRQQEEQKQQTMRIPDRHNNAVPLHVTRENNNSRISSTSDHGEAPKRQQQRRNSNASFSNTGDSEEEEIFDFSKISKNVRTFSEGVMSNGLRMFNNLSTRIKNANHNELDQLK